MAPAIRAARPDSRRAAYVWRRCGHRLGQRRVGRQHERLARHQAIAIGHGVGVRALYRPQEPGVRVPVLAPRNSCERVALLDDDVVLVRNATLDHAGITAADATPDVGVDVEVACR